MTSRWYVARGIPCKASLHPHRERNLEKSPVESSYVKLDAASSTGSGGGSPAFVRKMLVQCLAAEYAPSRWISRSLENCGEDELRDGFDRLTWGASQPLQ